MKVTDWLRRSVVVVVCLLCFGGLGRAAHADGYVAFSLQQAESQLRGGRRHASEVKRLAGISDPVALIYDPKTKDLILVGRTDHKLAVLTMDDFVVALRSILVHKTWPLVSIDKDKTSYETRRQKIRFEGGIANSAFGRDALDADVLLKNLAFGATTAEVRGITPYFDLLCRQAARGQTRAHVRTRFWFVGDEDASGFVDREGVAVVDNLTVAVQARAVAASETPADGTNAARDDIGAEFAATLSASFEGLVQEFPILRRIRVLYKLVAMAAGATALREKYPTFQPNVTYWLSQYELPHVSTPSDYPLVEKETTVSSAGQPIRVGLDGGLEFKELLLDLQDGSLTALRDMVLKCRPKPSALAWDVPLEYWNASESLGGRRVAQDPRLDALLRTCEQTVGVTLDAYIGGPRDSAARFEQRWATNLIASRPSIPRFAAQGSPPAAANIGGVMLSAAANIPGGPGRVNLTGGKFSLVVDGKNARIAPEAYRKFVTALWCVYYSDQDPGISIDPPPRQNRGKPTEAEMMKAEKHSVRYIGRVLNTDLGRVMREADYLMKKWAVGSEQANCPGMLSVDGYGRASEGEYFGQRFWFVPENLSFKRGGDLLLFDRGTMKVNTEYLNGSLPGGKNPSAEAFADFFTRHYDDIAEKNPVFKELFEYAKLVSLAKYLKQQGVPLLWFLLANKDLVLCEDSVREVDALIKRSDQTPGWIAKGGVDLRTECRYAYDQKTMAALQKAVERVPCVTLPATGLADGEHLVRSVPSQFSVDVGKRSYSVLPQNTLTSGKDWRGIHYQTDLALNQNGCPGLELVRYYDARNRDGGEFGQGWHLLVPYRLRPAGDAKREFHDRVIRQRIALENLLMGDREVLNFSEDRRAEAAYVPDNPRSSQVFRLFLMSDASFRLVDKLGNEFHFDQGGSLTRMSLSRDPKHHLRIEYVSDFTKAFERAPYAAQPADEERVSFLDAMVPKRVKVTDLLHGDGEMLTFHDKGRIPGYVPSDEKASRFRLLAILPNDGLQLVDKHGNETVFDPGWKFNKMLPSRDQRMVRLLSMGNQTVEFRYAIDRSGKLVIASASLASPQAPSRHVVRYEHDAEGRLCRVQHSEIPKSQDHRNQGSDLAMAEKSGLPFVRIGHPQ